MLTLLYQLNLAGGAQPVVVPLDTHDGDFEAPSRKRARKREEEARRKAAEKAKERPPIYQAPFAASISSGAMARALIPAAPAIEREQAEAIVSTPLVNVTDLVLARAEKERRDAEALRRAIEDDDDETIAAFLAFLDAA